MKINPRVRITLEEQRRRKKCYKENKADNNDHNHKYYAENLPYFREWAGKYEAENMPYYIMKAREQYARDPQKCIEKAKRWSKNNLPRVRELSRQRDQSIKENTKKQRDDYFAEERERLKNSQRDEGHQYERLQKILRGIPVN